jgi:hypothetical protein
VHGACGDDYGLEKVKLLSQGDDGAEGVLILLVKGNQVLAHGCGNCNLDMSDAGPTRVPSLVDVSTYSDGHSVWPLN